MDQIELSKCFIGVFDSGVGGLTVMRQLLKLLPNESFIYFGDTARLPYGEKSRETIIGYSLENADFLSAHNIKLLVVACNTASALALDVLKEHCDFPVIGVIGPGADCALQATKSGRIAVLGTRGTIQSQAYQNAIVERNPAAFVFAQACPLLVPLVEERFVHHPAARLIVREYLRPIQDKDIDTVLLGCTHYPLLLELIRQEMGDEVAIVDAAAACAAAVVAEQKRLDLGRSELVSTQHKYYVSDDPSKFQAHAEDFFGISLGYVEQVGPEYMNFTTQYRI